MAAGAQHLGVLTSVDAEGQAAEDAGADEQAQAPHPGDSSGDLLQVVGSVLLAEVAGGGRRQEGPGDDGLSRRVVVVVQLGRGNGLIGESLSWLWVGIVVAGWRRRRLLLVGEEWLVVGRLFVGHLFVWLCNLLEL